MEIRVLGPLQVLDGDGAIDITRPRERALLTMLASQPGQVVSTDRLIEGLWGDSSPVSATKTVQTYVHHLRSVLPADLIQTDGPGYRLAVEHGTVDWERFVDDLDNARRSTDPEEAERRIKAALERWRGSPFADAANADWLRPVRTRLDDLRLQAHRDLFEAELSLGRHHELIPEVRAILDEHPLREDLWAVYMLALYRAGRQADALRAYADARRRLAEELGIDPSSQLQQLEERILAQDPTLLAEATPDPAVPEAPTEPPDWSGEQRLVTILVARLVGTEPLVEALDREAAGRAIADVIETMTATVDRWGGTVLGREPAGFVAVFGVPAAREDDTYQALRTALRVVEQAHTHGREIQRAWQVDGVGLQAAVTTSHVTLPVDPGALNRGNARLDEMLEQAAPGVVIADEHSRKLMGDLFEWEPIAGIQEAWQVVGIRQRADKARWGRRLHSPLLGRDRELGDLEAALDALNRGIGGVVVLSGEAGVGKTRLLMEARNRSDDRTAWLAGHCAAYAEAHPYWPFRDMFRSWLGVGIDDTDLQVRLALHEKLEAVAGTGADDLYPYLGNLLGIALEPGQVARLQLSSEALRYRTFEVVATLLALLAESQPTVVVMEDLHWADSTSTQLLEQVLPLCERLAIMLVLTTRPAPDHPTRRLAETARQRHPHRTRDVRLDPLQEDAQRGMLAALVGSDTMPLRMVDKLLSLAEGNPFYLEELVGSLIDQGTLIATESGWELRDADVTVPETVEKVVQARIDSLDPAAHRLLTAASVLGRRFGLPLLQGVMSESAGLIETLETLLRLDLLVEARRWPYAEYLFRHALIQEAAYRTTASQQRLDLHRRAAEWLEQRHADNPDEVMSRLAYHWNSAGQEDKAIPALARAGDLARRDHALDEAVEHYRELLPLLERRGDRQAMALVLFKLAHALHQSLRFGESNDVYQRAFDLWEYQPSPEATETLRFRASPLRIVPDPVRSYMLTDIQVQMALFDRLVERWPDDTLVPSLAERWDIATDGLRYVFHLRPDLTWSDGVPLTAHDVEFGIKRNLDPERPGVSVAMFYVIEGAKDYVLGKSDDLSSVGVSALDDTAVEFRLIRPAPYLLGMLNRPDSGPQPRHAIEARGDDWSTLDNEVLSGAFRRVVHTDELLVLERRADYQGSRRGNVRVVERRSAPSQDNLRAYMRGEADVAWIGSRWGGRGLSEVDQSEVFVEPPAGLSYVVFNFRNGGVDDRRLRLALAHAVDRELLAEGAPGHVRVASGGVVPPFLAGHTPDIVLPYDLDLSRSLLRSAVVPSPLRILRLTNPVSQEWPQFDLVVEGWAERLNLDFEIVERDLFAGRDRDAFDIFEEGWYPGYTDPEYFLRLLLHSEAADNFGRWSNERFDELVERACAEREERPRLGLFHEADRLAVAEEAAVIPLSYSGNISLRRPEVEGWWEHGKSWANFADLTLHP